MMFCSKCGRPIPEGSAFCSECGAPVAGVTEKAENAAENVQGAAEKVQSAAENVADKVQNAAEAAEVNTQNAAEKAQNAAENAADKAQSTVENAAENMQNAAESAEVKAQGVAGIAAEKASEPGAEKAASGTQEQSSGKPKKKGKAGLVIGIILAIVLLLGASAGAAYIFAREQVENFIHVKFDKPEEYYTYVAKKNFDKSADLIPEGYDELVKKQMDIFNSAFHQKVQVKLGDRGKDFLKLAVGTGVDITWINSAAVDYATSTAYVNPGDINRYTVGAGYRGNHFYADFAYQYQQQNGEFHAFNTQRGDESGATPNDAPMTKLKLDRNQFLLTLGYKF